MALADKSEVFTETGVVDFLDIGQKTIDWRYQTWHELNRPDSDDDSRTIYWIGTIDLKRSHGDLVEPIYFTVHGFKLIKDRYVLREVNGIPSEDDGPSKVPYRYTFNHEDEVGNYIARIKNRYRYLHIFLEEMCWKDGRHNVAVLYNKAVDGKQAFYGIPSDVHWSMLPYEKIAWTKEVIAHAIGVVRRTVLVDGPYIWVEG